MFKKWFLILISACFATQLSASGGGEMFPHYDFKPNIHNQESLQRGAKYFVNYCAGCHGLKYQRYNRAFNDLGIDAKVGAENLIFTGAKAVEPMNTAMTADSGLKWFGQAPPDLSLTERARGRGYIYNYLLAFYLDDSRPLGFNNSVFPGASMPNPLWHLQGLQVPVYQQVEHCSGGTCEQHQELKGFKIVQAGTLNEQAYRQVAYDLANFLTYVSDPSALDRERLGPWVLAFLAFLTLIFYLLKREYWRDIH